MSASLHVPSVVPLADGTTLTLLEVVRDLPGRRVVCRGSRQGQPVYAKLFFGRKAVRDSSRDAAGVHALIEAGIPTPALLYAGSPAGGDGRVLVFAAVTDSQNAEYAWRALAQDAPGRLVLAQLLVATVAAHHQAGLVQHDMYLKNFLVTASQILTLDGDGIRRQQRPIDHRASLNNLAVLLSKFDVEDDDWAPQLFEGYARCRGWQVRAADVAWLQSSIAAHRQRVVRGYADKKVFRNCSDIVVDRAYRYFRAIVRQYDTADLRALLNEPDAWLAAADASLLKNGNTCTVAGVRMGERAAVVKRYNIKNSWHGLSRAWRPSRAAVSWSNAHRLLMYGIATAQPLALLERRWGGLRRQAYFVAAQVEAPDALQFFADPQVSNAQKTRAAWQVAGLLHKLGRLRIVHGDMKATNLKILQDGQPLLLDLDALYETRCNWRARRGQVRDLRRLLQNWRDAPQTSELLRTALQQVYQDAELLRKAGIRIQNSEEK